MRVSICPCLLLQQICDIWLTYRGLFPTRYQHSCHGHGSYVYDTYSSHALFCHCVIQITIFSTYHHFKYGDEDSYFLIGNVLARWRHRMEIFFALLVLCGGNPQVTSEFPSQRPLTRSFDIFFDPRPNLQLSKQWRSRWFETPYRSLWRHSNGNIAS